MAEWASEGERKRVSGVCKTAGSAVEAGQRIFLYALSGRFGRQGWVAPQEDILSRHDEMSGQVFVFCGRITRCFDKMQL